MTYTQEELDTIANCKNAGGNIWSNPDLEIVKKKLKDYHLSLTEEQCCYCRKNFHGEFRFEIDLEHILPKGKFAAYMFEIENLSVSCKRCNMMIKGEKTDFIVDVNTVIPDYKFSNKYYFIHPNFDNYFEHMDFDVVIKNSKKLIKYTALSDKGKFTYNFFLLSKLEIDNLNYVQGADYKRTDLSEKIPTNVQDELTELLKDI